MYVSECIYQWKSKPIMIHNWCEFAKVLYGQEDHSGWADQQKYQTSLKVKVIHIQKGFVAHHDI